MSQHDISMALGLALGRAKKGVKNAFKGFKNFVSDKDKHIDGMVEKEYVINNILRSNPELIAIIVPTDNEYVCIVAVRSTLKIKSTGTSNILSLGCNLSTNREFAKRCYDSIALDTFALSSAVDTDTIDNIKNSLTKVIYLKPKRYTTTDKVEYDLVTKVQLNMYKIYTSSPTEDVSGKCETIAHKFGLEYEDYHDLAIPDLKKCSYWHFKNPDKTIVICGDNVTVKHNNLEVSIPFENFKEIVPYITDGSTLDMNAFLEQYGYRQQGGRSNRKVTSKTGAMP